VAYRDVVLSRRKCHDYEMAGVGRTQGSPKGLDLHAEVVARETLPKPYQTFVRIRISHPLQASIVA